MIKLSLHAMQGSNVISGTAICVVLATGRDTYTGRIATSMSQGRQLNAFDFAVRRVVFLFIWFLVVMVRYTLNLALLSLLCIFQHLDSLSHDLLAQAASSCRKSRHVFGDFSDRLQGSAFTQCVYSLHLCKMMLGFQDLLAATVFHQHVTGLMTVRQPATFCQSRYM